MQIAVGDTAEIAFGLLLLSCGVFKSWSSLRDGSIRQVWRGVERRENPVLFWTLVGVFVGISMVGVILALEGLAHLRTSMG